MAVATTYRFGLASHEFPSGANDGDEFTVTATPTNILPANANRVLVGFRANTIAGTDAISLSFGRVAEDPDGTEAHGFILLPRAAPAGAPRPMWAPYPGPDGWHVFGPGGNFPFCPLGAISARCGAAKSESLLVMEIDL